MFVIILIEVIILVAILFVGHSLWQLFKRDRFMKNVVGNQSLLDQFISKDLFVNPPQRVALFAQKNDIGWFMNIQILLRADKSTQRRIEAAYLILVLLLLAGSYLLGIGFLIINSICFLLLNFFPVSDTAKRNALENLHCLALILHRWRSDNTLECDQWIQQATSLQKLYNAVKQTGS